MGTRFRADFCLLPDVYCLAAAVALCADQKTAAKTRPVPVASGFCLRDLILLTNLSPVWVGIASSLFLHDKPGRQFWIGTVIALSGMVILMGIDTFAVMRFDKGFLMALTSGLLYASYMIVSKRVLNSLKIVSFMVYSMSVSSIYLLLICLLNGEPLWNFTPVVWGVLGIQGIICQLLGWLTISYAVQKLDAQRVSLALLSQSVVTGLLAWLFIHEKVSLQMIIGGIVILIGIGITFIKRKSLV
jgi:drug/metabolite transporter (DMT)-like permease